MMTENESLRSVLIERLSGGFGFLISFRKNANSSIRTHSATTKGVSSLTLTGTRSCCFTAALNGQRQNTCMPQQHRKVPTITIPSGGHKLIPAEGCACRQSLHCLLHWQYLQFSCWATPRQLAHQHKIHCNLQLCARIGANSCVWFSWCSRGSSAAGTASSWFKASPGMCTWPAPGELTGRHDLLSAPDYTVASRSPWAFWGFTSVLSPQLHFFSLS